MRIVSVLTVVSALLSGSLFGDEDLQLHASGMFEEPSDEEMSSLSTRHLFKASEEEPRGSVFFRGAWTLLSGDRGSEVFTDTLGAGNENDDDTGWAVAAGLDLNLGHKFLWGDLLGQIFVEFSEFSNKRVVQLTSAALGAPTTSRVSVTQLTIVIAPKVAWEFDRIRPWIIPVGMAFILNSPPSDDTTYADVGLHFGGGVEYMVFAPLSLGVDVRYTLGFEQADTETDYLSVGGYLGVNF